MPIDSTTIQHVVDQTSRGYIPTVTGIVIALILLSESLKKWGPFLLSIFKRETIEKVNGISQCPMHNDLIDKIAENTAAVKMLTEHADQHHQDQREDIGRLFDKIEEQGKLIAVHGNEIERLHEERFP